MSEACSCWDGNEPPDLPRAPQPPFGKRSGAEILTPAELSHIRPRQVFKASAGGGTFRGVLVAGAADVAHVAPNRKEINPLVRLGQDSKPQPCRGSTAPWQSRKASLKEPPRQEACKINLGITETLSRRCFGKAPCVHRRLILLSSQAAALLNAPCAKRG